MRGAAAARTGTSAPATGTRRDALRVLTLLRRLYPDAACTLDFRGPFELLVATVLSAQCTDERVNRVTPELFARFPDAESMARAPRAAIEELIRSAGFFRNKAKSIQTAAQRIVETYGGRVPDTLEELLTLPGTGRKTANVILGNAYGTPGITVDTHVQRVTRRLGWTAQTDPVKIEFELNALIPRKDWTIVSHRLIQHGRRVCHARKPDCGSCALRPHCPFGRPPAANADPTAADPPAPAARRAARARDRDRSPSCGRAPRGAGSPASTPAAPARSRARR
jgi:endonuclease III